MTTIAWDGVTLAADRCSWSGAARRQVRKVFNIKASDEKRFLVGFCGDGAFALAVLDWMQGKAPKPMYTVYGVRADEQCALVIDEARVVWGVSGTLAYYRFEENMMALGSGQAYAWGALEAGASAQRAIEIAIKRSDFAAFGVDTVTFDEEPTP
jgi:ATP-dependent protease HslVU (ClpYQ) peptidase subunit